MVYSSLLLDDSRILEAFDRPNVILILADDLAIGDLSSSNGGLSRTPSLDQLATNSVRFQNAYSASCVCAPARAAVLTGRYPHRTGVVTLNMNRYPSLTRLKLDETTIADALSENGYVTGLIGKWHCGHEAEYHPLKRGFDEFEGFTGSQNLSYFDYTLDVNGRPVHSADNYLTDDLTRRAINFVRRHRDQPFFLHLAHYAPHRPLNAPAELVQSYQDKGLNESQATIYAMIEIMDRGIGELLAELDRLELASRTLVIFSSDNGPDPITGTRFNEHHRGTKYEVYEGGIRVPLFFRWLGRLKPGDREQIVHFVDLFPTIIDISGVRHTPELPLDGMSLKDILSGNSEPLQRRVYWQWNRGEPNYTHNSAVREGNWKLVKPFITRAANPDDSRRKPVLFDLSNDPSEKRDVSARYSNRYSAMLRELDQWSAQMERSRTRKRE
ncbi:arylsulfatase [Calycomorphotria hydatis]|nr:arylsulfatase [Calycomorphotria hydatis]